MPEQPVLALNDLPANTKKTITLSDTKILLIRTATPPTAPPTLFAVEAECLHAKAPLEQGAVCNGRLVCPWHTGNFDLATGTLLEPPPLRDLKRFPVRLAGEDILIDPTPISANKTAPTGQDKHLVFAGAGAATAAALAYLRDQNFAGLITVIEPYPEEPVDRTPLTKMSLTGKKPLDTLPIFSPPGQESPDSLDALNLTRVQATVEQLHREVHSLAVGSPSDMWALASTQTSLPEGVLPIASQQAPGLGQNALRLFLMVTKPKLLKCFIGTKFLVLLTLKRADPLDISSSGQLNSSRTRSSRTSA